jgi:hypothetical protein
MISFVFFLFLFFAKFLVMAFFAATILTFIAFVIRKIKATSQYDYAQEYNPYHWRNSNQRGLPYYNRHEEPLFFDKQKETEFNWLHDYRTIKVQ